MSDREVPRTVELDALRAQVVDVRRTLSSLQRELRETEAQLRSSTVAQMRAANEQLVIAMLRAQAEQEVAAQEIANISRRAATDDLTELPNRVLLRDRFTHAVAAAKRRSGRLALLFVDLDDFKGINDTFGHNAGDAVLKHVAMCLGAAVRGSDTVSRIGGDEFVILLSDIALDSDVVLVAEKIRAALAAPMTVDAQQLRLSASIGISIYPEDGDLLETLLGIADSAMYRAKHSGVGRYRYQRTRAVSGDETLSPQTAPPP